MPGCNPGKPVDLTASLIILTCYSSRSITLLLLVFHNNFVNTCLSSAYCVICSCKTCERNGYTPRLTLKITFIRLSSTIDHVMNFTLWWLTNTMLSLKATYSWMSGQQFRIFLLPLDILPLEYIELVTSTLQTWNPRWIY